MIRDGLKDVIKHTYDLGFVDQVRIDATDKGTTVFAQENDKMVIINAEFKDSWKDLEGKIGLNELKMLKWVLSSEMFKGDGSSVTVKSDIDSKTKEEYVAEFEFTGNGDQYNHRFMHPAIVEKHLAPYGPSVGEDEWTLRFKPVQEKVKNFISAAGMIQSYEPMFTFEMDGSNLLVDLGGDRGANRIKIVLAEQVSGKISKQFRWNIVKVLSVLRMAENAADAEILLMDNGTDAIMVVRIDSGLAKWEYSIPPLS